MSNYSQPTRHPITKKIEQAEWLDDYFGHHRYGVRFSDGAVFCEEEIEQTRDSESLIDNSVASD